MKKKKYKKGERVESIIDFIDAAEKGKSFYWRHKFMAPGFIVNWSVVMIKNSIKYGNLKYAVLNNITKEKP